MCYILRLLPETRDYITEAAAGPVAETQRWADVYAIENVNHLHHHRRPYIR